MKSTASERYQVKPNLVNLLPGESVTVKIKFVSIAGMTPSASSLNKDKFLFAAQLTKREGLSTKRMNQKVHRVRKNFQLTKKSCVSRTAWYYVIFSSPRQRSQIPSTTSGVS